MRPRAPKPALAASADRGREHSAAGERALQRPRHEMGELPDLFAASSCIVTFEARGALDAYFPSETPESRAHASRSSRCAPSSLAARFGARRIL